MWRHNWSKQILHEDFRPQVGEGKARPFDVALDKLMPRMMRDPGIVIPTGAETDDVLYPGSLSPRSRDPCSAEACQSCSR